jgi:hypothetical protein
MEVNMRKSIVAIAALGVALLLGLYVSPTLAADAGSASRLPEAVTTLKPGVVLASYKHCDYSGCYYCQSRECDSYGYNYGRRYCTHFHYYDCSSYGGGGGGYHRHYQGGGGGY